MNPVWRNPWVRAFGVLLAIAGAAVLVYFLSGVLVPLLFAFLVAHVFDPVVDKLETYRIPRGGAVAAVIIAVLLVVFVLPLFLLPVVAVNSQEIFREVREERTAMRELRHVFAALDADANGTLTYEEARRGAPRMTAEQYDAWGVEELAPKADVTWPERLLRKVPFAMVADTLHVPVVTTATEEEEAAAIAAGLDVAVVETMPAPASGLDAEAVPEAASAEVVVVDAGERNTLALHALQEQARSWLEANTANYLKLHTAALADAGQWAGSSLMDVVRSIWFFLVGALTTIGNIALFTVVAMYLLKDYDEIILGIRGLVPPRWRPDVERVGGKVDLQLRGFLRGQLLVCIVLGTMYALGFWACRVPFGVLIGLLGGIASFVPYLGSLLAFLAAFTLTLVVHGADGHLLGVLVTFAVAQFLESNFLTPRIVGSQVGLGPVAVIMAVMVFGTTFGFAGILLAVPTAAVLKVLVDEAISYYRRSRLFSAPPDTSA